MRLSHSKLSCILSCPMTYYLQNKQKIFKKIEKPALAIGSAVHWGIEHNTEDLEQYFKDNGTFNQAMGFTRDQLLAESMVHGYLKHKDNIFNDILTDNETGEKLELLDEIHELYITGKLKSLAVKDSNHDFVGIIDLLLLTNKGWIVIDYKTSSREPNWNDYLEQLYRYIFLLRSEFPDVPVYKLGIINIRKTQIRQKKGENDFSYLHRMKMEYDINDENYVNYHLYSPNEFDKTLLDNYILNLSKMADTANLIDENNMWFINYPAANGVYGKSDYWDIFYKTPDCHVLYVIVDKVYDSNEDKLVDVRDCVPLDMEVIDYNNILNKYEQFKVQALSYYSVKNSMDKNELFQYIKNNFRTDDYLLELYWTTLNYEVQNDLI